MLDGAPKYPVYKDSGEIWLGEIPVDWELESIRAVTELKSKRGEPDWRVLSVYRDYGVIPKDSRDDNHNATSLDTSNYKVVEPGDLVVNKMKAWQGSMGVSEHSGIVSPAYITCRTDPDKVVARFLHYTLRSQPFIAVYNSLSYGVRIGQWDMHYDDFKKIPLAYPDLDTQNRIVGFLDEKTAEIDAAIAKKRRLIDLLNEQKAILINRAVTKGLNPDAPMKDSGVDWIGEIPAHWDILRNQRFLRQRKVVVGKRSEDFVLLSLTLRGVIERDMENPEGKFPAEFDSYQVVRPGDFVFCHFDVEETPRTVGLSRFHGMITGAYTVYECLAPEYSEYIERLYISLDQDKLLRPLYSGLRNTIDKTVFAHTKIPVPPAVEVEEILLKIRQAEAETGKVVSAIEREISILNEFKQTLIANAVTGKIKI